MCHAASCLPSDCHQDRYHAFLIMIREWRHLKMMKRAGRGNDVSGIDATQLGECAVHCPACPQPGKNIPLAPWPDEDTGTSQADYARPTPPTEAMAVSDDGTPFPECSLEPVSERGKPRRYVFMVLRSQPCSDHV